MKAAEAIETRWSRRPSRKDLLRGDPAIAAVKCAGLLLQCLRDLDKMQALLQQEASVEVFTTYKLSYAMMLFASAQNEMDLPKKMPLEVWSFLLYGYHTSRFGVFSFSDYKKNVQKVKEVEELSVSIVSLWCTKTGYAKRMPKKFNFELTAEGREVMAKIDLYMEDALNMLNDSSVKMHGSKKLLRKKQVNANREDIRT